MAMSEKRTEQQPGKYAHNRRTPSSELSREQSSEPACDPADEASFGTMSNAMSEAASEVLAEFCLDVHEASEILCVSLARLSQITGKGNLSYLRKRIGTRWRIFYKRSEIENYLSQQSMPPVQRSGPLGVGQRPLQGASASAEHKNYGERSLQDSLNSPGQYARIGASDAGFMNESSSSSSSSNSSNASSSSISSNLSAAPLSPTLTPETFDVRRSFGTGKHRAVTHSSGQMLSALHEQKAQEDAKNLLEIHESMRRMEGELCSLRDEMVGSIRELRQRNELQFTQVLKTLDCFGKQQRLALGSDSAGEFSAFSDVLLNFRQKANHQKNENKHKNTKQSRNKQCFRRNFVK